MKNNQILKATNSGTLETTENFRKTVTSEIVLNVADDVTEDSDCFISDYEKTEDDYGNIEYDAAEDVENKNTDDTTNTHCIKIRNLCDESNLSTFSRIVPTKHVNNCAEKVMSGLLTKTKTAVTIIGDSGSGKKTLVNYIAGCITTKKCPPVFSENKTVIYEINLNLMDIVSDLNTVLDYAKSEGVKNVILYVNDFEEISNSLIDCYESTLESINIDEFELFKFIFVFHDGGYCEDCDDDVFANFFTEHSIVIEVDTEKNPMDILKVLHYEIEAMEKMHKVKFSSEALKLLLMCYYGRHYTENFSYTNFICAVDTVLAQAEFKGKAEATVKDVQDYYCKSFQVMSKLPAEYNKLTAIHETGHILLALKNPRLFDMYGCSILRDCSSEIEAITCLRKTYYNAYSEEDEIRYVAILLAGRAAELEMTKGSDYIRYFVHRAKNVNKGASDDLINATEELRSWVINNGAYFSTGYNVVNYDYFKLTTSMRKKVDCIVKWLMKKAYNYAKMTIKNDRKFMIVLSKHLLKNYVATREEIFEIARKTIKK